MLFSRASTLALGLLASSLVSAQTFSKCNPLKQQCPANPALGTSKSVDFTSGQSGDFTASGNSITYGSNGAEMTVAKSGDAPLLISNWYLMFGKIEVVMKATPGTGMVTSAILESDDLDEIDWEMLGSQPDQVQTNYFGKGQTGSYDRGGTSANPGSQTTFKKYTVEWTSTQIVWSIDGQTTRILQASQANGQFPQTPMRIKIGPWAGGDSSNAPGVQAWAGGATNYASGPFRMYVKSVAATDYSTGRSYAYSGTDGTWQQVKSDGGSISGGPSKVETSGTPAQVTTTSGQPVPFAGTHADPSSSGSATRPSVYPWVSEASTFTSVSSAPATSIPGLPAGWSVSSSGKVVPPPSAAPSTAPTASSTSPPQPSPPASSPASPVNAGAAAPGSQAASSVASLVTAAPSASAGGFTTAANGTFAQTQTPSNTASAGSQPAFTGGAAPIAAMPVATSQLAAGFAALVMGALSFLL